MSYDTVDITTMEDGGFRRKALVGTDAPVLVVGAGDDMAEVRETLAGYGITIAERGYPLREDYPNRGEYRKAVAKWRRGS